jgi:hypothetical protein
MKLINKDLRSERQRAWPSSSTYALMGKITRVIRVQVVDRLFQTEVNVIRLFMENPSPHKK